MNPNAFECLQGMAQLVRAKAAPAPAMQQKIQDWHGAAVSILGVRCVISADETRKIVDVPETIPLPGVKPWVRGIANIGGRVVSISDLSAFLSGGSRTSNGRQALIINGRGIHTGLLIDECFGGVRLSTEELRTNKKVAKELQAFVRGVFSTEDGEYALFDTNRLLTDANFTQAGVITTS
ncbi:chemotaxis protein CheW [Mangrovimicrobium sediminis]|uniref:Chemotaxis protein CheW n=1 Tax=Mangrovimicrobium sediminis TaxID=2562682 RepID=A0A4Z0LUJ6_9GAMM|nr:chemotaxis protein CheW [Haliea sp. SAOS-164]TGD70914.1 chemotaxis protein CheW [Haliea sp. SAOS-164]